jgi:hypothetical protein
MTRLIKNNKWTIPRRRDALHKEALSHPEVFTIYIDVVNTINSIDPKALEEYILRPEVLMGEPTIKNIPKEWVLLTKVSTPKEEALRKLWAKKYFPNNKLIIVHKYESKAQYATPTSILIDDFNDNLHEWKVAGGTAIKLLNHMNSKTKKYTCVTKEFLESFA